jgi:type IV pilus assembly protein PilF
MDKHKEKSLKDPRLSWVIGCIFSMVLMTGCVTTNTGPSKKPEVDTEKVMQNRLQLALGYMGKGDHERAREHLNKATEVNSRSPELHDVWALLYQREMELEAAESHYKKALSYDPTFTRGRNNYGLFLMKLNRIEEAHQQFVKGSEDLGYPKRSELLFKVGLTALKLDRVQEAEDAFTKSAVLNPQMSAAYLELAEIAYKRSDNDRSKKLLDKYNKTKSNASPKGLWLGIRLDNSFGNQNAEASQGMALRKLFPNSQENLEYQNWLKNERKNP